MNKQKPITIGVLAKLADVGVETVRFYERKGLITQPPKNMGIVIIRVMMLSEFVSLKKPRKMVLP
jgi:MerR family mercuric resistance operon transcriptional regulator